MEFPRIHIIFVVIGVRVVVMVGVVVIMIAPRVGVLEDVLLILRKTRT